MGWNPIRDIKKAVEKVVEAMKDAVVAPVRAAVDIVEGKPVGDALKEALAAQIKPVNAAADLNASVAALQSTVVQQVASGIAGPTAGDIVADLQRLTQPVDANTAAAVIQATEQFVLTGDLGSLQPAAVLMAAEIERCRNLLHPIGSPVPNEVVTSLPEEFRAICQGVHVMARAAVPGTLNAPSIAIKHLGTAGAMCLMDVIVFDSVPGFQTKSDLFYWTHELQHVRQYKIKGTIGFCKEYIGEELGFKAKGRTVNALEADADYAACRLYPIVKPFYIESCPI